MFVDPEMVDEIIALCLPAGYYALAFVPLTYYVVIESVFLQNVNCSEYGEYSK